MKCFFLVLISLMIIGVNGNTQVAATQKKSYVKTSLNAFSFNTLLTQNMKDKSKGLDLFQLLDFVARNNFDAIDITGYYFPGYPAVPDDEYINRVKKYAFQLGIDISGTGVKNDFANPDASKRAADVKLVKAWIDVAAKLGAPVIRVFSGKVPEGYENRRAEILVYMVECLKECVAYGKEKGVMVGIQNHGDFLSTAEQCIELIKLVNSDWFGLVLDTGTFLTDDPYADIEKVIPHAINFQVKESLMVAGKPGSPVKMDLKRLMKIIHASEYRGYLPIETLELKGEPGPVPDIPYDPFIVVPQFLKAVKAAIREEYKEGVQ